MSKNWRLKNFRIDPLLDDKFTKKCGPVKQGDILNELIRKFLNNEIIINIEGWSSNTNGDKHVENKPEQERTQ